MNVAPRAREQSPSALLIASVRAARRPQTILEAAGIPLRRIPSPRQLPGLAEGCSLCLLCVTSLARELAAALAHIERELPGTPVLALAPRAERWELRRSIAAGVAAVVLDDETLARSLIPTVEAVLAGQTCVPREHAREIAPPALSAREKQILGLVVMGYMNSQIASQLFLAEATVKSHLYSAFRKLGVRSRNEATRLILDPAQGLGMGILALSGESARSQGAAV
ncbi:MAG TPA: response regulator transcription factor [Solirubrobacteraceae bacterium]